MSFAKLRGRIVEKFGTQKEFAKAMGLREAFLSAKLTGKVGWTYDEVVNACSLLAIPLEEAHLYFFCAKSCTNATV